MFKVHKSEITKNVINTKNYEYIQVHCPNDLERRSLLSGPENLTQRLSNLIEMLLKPLVHTLKHV